MSNNIYDLKSRIEVVKLDVVQIKEDIKRILIFQGGVCCTTKEWEMADEEWCLLRDEIDTLKEFVKTI